VIAFSASASGNRIVFGIENPQKEVVDEKTRRDGLVISNQPLAQLIAGRIQVCCQQLFVLDAAQNAARPLHVQGRLWQDPLQLNVSPDGRYVIAKTNAVTFPALWNGYTNEGLKELLALGVPKGSPTSYIDRYEIIDIGSDSSSYLLDSPAGGLSDLVWSPDSRSVVAAGVFLPLDVHDAAEVAARKAGIFTVEITIPQQDIIQIADRELKLLGWDRVQRTLRFRRTRNENPTGDDATLLYYRKQGNRWENFAPEIPNSVPLLPDIRVEQDLNTPPRVVAEDPTTKRAALTFDLNPQFKDIDFGKVEEISWTGGGGRPVHGGLYLPPGYVRGRRYPLVIQTHGFDPHGFWIDGSFTTGFAAQTLAGREIVVLQVPDSHDAMDTPEEAPLMVETYEKAIDYLAARGIIDREHTGIIGFSRTCFYVKYMLSHSKYPVSAAVADDGIDGGYFSYVALPHLDDEYDRLLGAPPVGEGLSIWLKRSPSFLLDKVRTPLRIEANGPESILEEWQWFSGLARLGQPVEFIYLPEGDHILEKPSERLVSQQGNVDWLCFWLKGEEDPDPTKADQYIRWRNLRGLSATN
jgi:dipeptidyl aminopeptidase/acylaminoacyl peptidase